MTSDTTKPDSAQPADERTSHLFDNWFDPIESALRERVRGFIEELIHAELDAALARPRYGRRAKNADGAEVVGRFRPPARESDAHAHGHLRQDRDRGAAGQAGHAGDGRTTEWRSKPFAPTSGARLRPMR